MNRYWDPGFYTALSFESVPTGGAEFGVALILCDLCMLFSTLLSYI
jgi:hypothetical protein